MVLDKKNLFSWEQAVAGDAGDAVDAELALEVGAGDLGASSISLFVNIFEPFTGDGALEVWLVTTDETDAAGFISPVTLAKYPVSNETLKKGGAAVACGIPSGCKSNLTLIYAITDGSLADGKISAGLVMDK